MPVRRGPVPDFVKEEYGEISDKIYGPDWEKEFYKDHGIDPESEDKPSLSPLWIRPKALADPKQMTPWEGFRFKRLRIANMFGHIRPYWTERDYLIEAVEDPKGGYETCIQWGCQASGKSNRTMQEGHWIYQDWDLVLEHIVFRPQELQEKFKAISTGYRYPWIGWDDVGVHFPSSTWRTDVEVYAAIDQTWTAIRTKCNVISMSIPVIDRLSRVLRDNITFEVYVGKNQAVMVERCFRLPNYKKMESIFMKVLVEPVHQFDLYEVPSDVFKEYYQRRLELAEEATAMLGDVVKVKEVGNWITYLDAMKICKGLITTTALNDYVNRNVIRHIDMGNPKQRHLNRDDFEAFVDFYTTRKGITRMRRKQPIPDPHARYHRPNVEEKRPK